MPKTYNTGAVGRAAVSRPRPNLYRKRLIASMGKPPKTTYAYYPLADMHGNKLSDSNGNQLMAKVLQPNILRGD